jgi:hypothetical protein
MVIVVVSALGFGSLVAYFRRFLLNTILVFIAVGIVYGLGYALYQNM